MRSHTPPRSRPRPPAHAPSLLLFRAEAHTRQTALYRALGDVPDLSGAAHQKAGQIREKDEETMGELGAGILEEVFDRLVDAKELDPYEQALYLLLVRESRLRGMEQVRISMKFPVEMVIATSLPRATPVTQNG